MTNPSEQQPAARLPEHAAPRPIVVASAMPELFDACGEAVISDGRQEVPFKHLRQLAKCVARGLTGCPPGTLAIHLPRGIELVATIVGALEAGRAYAVLDRSRPAGALEQEAALTECAVLLTDTIPPPFSGPVLGLHDLLERGQRFSDRAVCESASSESTAYVLLTSGSMGQRKAVKMSQRAVCLYTAKIQDRLGLRPTDRVVHLASFAFSSSIRQLFAPLYAGAHLVVADDAARSDAAAVLDLLCSQRITVLDTVPSACRALAVIAAETGAGPRSRLRMFVSSGEPLDWDTVHLVRRAFRPDLRVVNVYGQTETIGVSTYDVPCDPSGTASVPIGTPLDGVALSLRPDRTEPNAIDEGEIVVESPMVMQAYREGPDGPFVPAEKGTDGQTRRHSTGDIAVLHANGLLRVAGRADLQLKINGQRVDLAEVERNVREAIIGAEVIAMAQEIAQAGRQLIAFVAGRTFSHEELSAARQRLEQTLAPHLRPHRLVPIPVIPKTPTGKRDFAQLRRYLDRPGTVDAARPLSTGPGLEGHCISMISSVLGTSVSLDDDFLAARGSSLSAALIAVRLSCVHPRMVAADVLEARTIGALIARVVADVDQASRRLDALLRSSSSRSALAWRSDLSWSSIRLDVDGSWQALRASVHGAIGPSADGHTQVLFFGPFEAERPSAVLFSAAELMAHDDVEAFYKTHSDRIFDRLDLIELHDRDLMERVRERCARGRQIEHHPALSSPRRATPAAR